MLRQYIQLTEDALGQQEINLISQKIVDYLNANPQLVKDGKRVDLSAMGLDPKSFKSPQIQQLVMAGQINFRPHGEFTQLPNGRFSYDLPNASASTWFTDPKQNYAYDPKVATPYGMARSDKFNAKPTAPFGPMDPRLPDWIERTGNKLQINIPSEIITGNLNINAPKDGTRMSSSYAAKRSAETLGNMRSTIAHELNHQYNVLQGMDVSQTRRKVDANIDAAQIKAKVDAIPPGTDLKTIPDQLVRKAVEYRDQLAALRQQEPALQKALTAATRSGDPTATKLATDQLANLRDQIRDLQTKNAVWNPKVDAKMGTDWDHTYWGTKTELNSRLQQAVEQMARDVKPGLTNEQIVAMIEKSFLDQRITQEYVDPAKMPKSFPGGEVADKEFRQFIRQGLKTAAPEFQREAFNSALKNPEYRKLFNNAVKFISQQQTSPVDLASTAGKASWSAKFRALLTGIPQSQIQQSLLPSTWNSIQIGTTRLDAAGEQFAKQIAQAPKTAINTVKATAAPAFKAGGWLVMGYVIYAEVAKAVERYQALNPKTMTRMQYQGEVTKIVAQPVGRFGLGIVAGVFGAALAGTVASPTVVGVIPAAILGFASGFAVSVAADIKYGDSMEAFVAMLVDRAYATVDQFQDGHSRSWKGVPGTPQYQQTGPVKEELDRVRKLAGV
jgi:hypothetical protein